MLRFTVLLFLGTIVASSCHALRRFDDDCMLHALTQAGISLSNARTYAERFAIAGISLSTLLASDNSKLRNLGVISEEDRRRISVCHHINSDDNSSPVTSATACHLDGICNGRGVCDVRGNKRPSSQLHYVCNCNAGYSGDRCQKISYNCLSNPCSHGGRCENGVNNFTCHCKVGYRGRLCQEKWLTRNGTRSRLQQLTTEIKDSIVNSDYSLHDLIDQQSIIIRRLESSIAELKRSRLPKYRVFTDRLNASSAAYQCSLYGGGLAMVKNAEDQREIYNLALRYKLPHVWLGAGDQLIEGNWYWWDRSPMIFNNFLPNEPNDSKGVEDCLEMLVITANIRGIWNDVNCNWRRPFICQFH